MGDPVDDQSEDPEPDDHGGLARMCRSPAGEPVVDRPAGPPEELPQLGTEGDDGHQGGDQDQAAEHRTEQAARAPRRVTLTGHLVPLPGRCCS